MYDYYTKKPKDTHLRDIWLETLQPFGIKPKSNQYDLFCTNSQIQVAKNFITKFHGKFLIGINLEGAVKGKRIRNTELEQICRGVKQENIDIQIIILTSPKNHQAVSKLVKDMDLNYVAVGFKTRTILDVAGLIKHLDLIISPDTSIVHIASAFNKPIVSIHEKNQDSYQLFSPTSSLTRTVFSPRENSINGFDVRKVIEFSNELIKEIS
jgi:ADP-heptose:LPS heptosyltransferase